MPTFLSKSPNQILCIKPQRMQVVDGVTIPVAGEHIRFENGEYTTTDAKEIAFLRKHRFFGLSIIEKEEPKKAAAAPAQ